MFRVTAAVARALSTMRAVTMKGNGGVDVLEVTAVPIPVPKPGEALVRVAYAGVNGPDLLQVRPLVRC